MSLVPTRHGVGRGVLRSGSAARGLAQLSEFLAGQAPVSRLGAG